MAIPNQFIFLFLQIPLALLLSLSVQPSSAQLRSICITQFTLANQACSVLLSLDAPMMAEAPAPVDQPGSHNDANNDTHAGDTGRPHDHHDDHDHGDEARHEHEGGHGHGRHEHGHGHANDRRQKHRDIPRAYKDCCRWLEEVEHECVCEALLRLPPFLIKHSHMYSLQVEEACKFTYKCHAV